MREVNEERNWEDKRKWQQKIKFTQFRLKSLNSSTLQIVGLGAGDEREHCILSHKKYITVLKYKTYHCVTGCSMLLITTSLKGPVCWLNRYQAYLWSCWITTLGKLKSTPSASIIDCISYLQATLSLCFE